MKKLSYDFRIPGRSIAEVHDRFERALLSHQQGRAVKFNDRKLSAEAFTNAVVLHFLELPEAEQRRILAEFVPKFEAMLTDDPGPLAVPEMGRAVSPTGSKPKRKGKAG